jgi:hypothetical protein
MSKPNILRNRLEALPNVLQGLTGTFLSGQEIAAVRSIALSAGKSQFHRGVDYLCVSSPDAPEKLRTAIANHARIHHLSLFLDLDQTSLSDLVHMFAKNIGTTLAPYLKTFELHVRGTQNPKSFDNILSLLGSMGEIRFGEITSLIVNITRMRLRLSNSERFYKLMPAVSDFSENAPKLTHLAILCGDNQTGHQVDLRTMKQMEESEWIALFHRVQSLRTDCSFFMERFAPNTIWAHLRYYENLSQKNSLDVVFDEKHFPALVGLSVYSIQLRDVDKVYKALCMYENEEGARSDVDAARDNNTERVQWLRAIAAAYPSSYLTTKAAELENEANDDSALVQEMRALKIYQPTPCIHAKLQYLSMKTVPDPVSLGWAYPALLLLIVTHMSLPADGSLSRVRRADLPLFSHVTELFVDTCTTRKELLARLHLTPEKPNQPDQQPLRDIAEVHPLAVEASRQFLINQGLSIWSGACNRLDSVLTKINAS